jgi:hypothetical protein
VYVKYSLRKKPCVKISGKAMNASLIAGLVAGVAGLLTFLIIHHFWIKPIWFILPPGLLIAGLGGLAVGWSYWELRGGLPSYPWTVLGVILLIGAVLAPAVILAQLREPILDLETFTIPPEATGRAIRYAILELALPAIVVGSAAGWLLSHHWRGSVATALAGLVFALGPGHNIPFLANTPATAKGIVLLAAIVFVSSLVLVESSKWLAAR